MKMEINSQPPDDMQRFYQTGELPEQDQADSPSAAAAGSLPALLEQLVEQWERRATAADKFANDAAGAGDYTGQIRCKAKAGTTRAMTIELKRAIREANS